MPRRFLLRLLAANVSIGDLFTDGELLRRFTQDRDSAALELLIRRHANAVWTACRRVLASDADAEDAFQATFLILTRKAGAIRAACIGGWLHRVAVTTALKLKVRSGRLMLAPTEQLTAVASPSSPAVLDLEILSIVQEELARLPERYRLPVVLCELEGHTHAEAAKLLGWPIGSVSGRLSRARSILRKNLSRRGVSAPVILVPVIGLPAALVCNTAAAATGNTLVKPSVSNLAEGVLFIMRISKCKVLAIWIISVGLTWLAGFGTFIALAQGPVDGNKSRPTQPVEPLPKESGEAKKPDQKADAGARELKAFQGTWIVVGLETDGKKVPAQDVTGMRWVIKGREIEGFDPGEKSGKKFEFKFDHSKEPKHIDLDGFGEKKGQTFFGIYKLENGRLTICFREKERPKEFTADAGGDQAMIILESVTITPKPPAKQ